VDFISGAVQAMRACGTAVALSPLFCYEQFDRFQAEGEAWAGQPGWREPSFSGGDSKDSAGGQDRRECVDNRETGTGKEVVARAIHYLSPRAGKPFCAFELRRAPFGVGRKTKCSGTSVELSTGASSTQEGLIQEADGGTLFLDEVDCMPPPAQVKMLRFLQEREFRPLGATKTQRADVRILAATNSDLDQAVSSGRLRRDLFYRLNTVALRLPSLRERGADIVLLARHFVGKACAKFNIPTKELSAGVLQQLLAYSWPGNVRELEHVVERAVVMSWQQSIAMENIDLPGLRPVPTAPSFREAKAGL